MSTHEHRWEKCVCGEYLSERAAPRAEGLDAAIRAVTEYSWGLHLAGTPNEAEAIALIENLRRLSRPSDEEEKPQRVQEQCLRFRHDEHCAHLHES